MKRQDTNNVLFMGYSTLQVATWQALEAAGFTDTLKWILRYKITRNLTVEASRLHKWWQMSRRVLLNCL
jgi:hypothetical protein